MGCPNEPAPIPTELELDGEFISFYSENFNIKFSAKTKQFTFKLPVYTDSSATERIFEEHTVNYAVVNDIIETYKIETYHTGTNSNGVPGNYLFTINYEIKVNKDDYDSITVTKVVTNEVGNQERYDYLYVKKYTDDFSISGTWKNGNQTLYVKDYEAILERDGKVIGRGSFDLLLAGTQNIFWCEIEDGYEVINGVVLASNSKLYIDDEVTGNLITFSKQSSLISSLPESQNIYIGKYKNINNDTLIVENSRILADINTIYSWNDSLNLIPKTSELKYSYDLFSKDKGYIYGSQELIFDNIKLDVTNTPYVFDTEKSSGKFYFEKSGTKGFYKFKQDFDIYGGRYFEDSSFLKVSKNADFVGTWTIEEPFSDLESATLTINPDGSFVLDANDNHEEGSIKVETANKESYFSVHNCLKGIMAEDGKLYLRFLFTVKEDEEVKKYYIDKFFVKK